jgi:predicted histone-like DNA-binding protein
MSVKYKTLARRNPQDNAAPAKFYAAVTANGSVDFETLAEMISEQSALSESDCLAMLNILETNIVRELRQGRIVRLGKLGNFQISLSSMGFATEQEVTAEAIKNSRVLFRPSKKLRSLLKNLSFSRLS